MNNRTFLQNLAIVCGLIGVLCYALAFQWTGSEVPGALAVGVLVITSLFMLAQFVHQVFSMKLADFHPIGALFECILMFGLFYTAFAMVSPQGEFITLPHQIHAASTATTVILNLPYAVVDGLAFSLANTFMISDTQVTAKGWGGFLVVAQAVVTMTIIMIGILKMFSKRKGTRLVW